MNQSLLERAVELRKQFLAALETLPPNPSEQLDTALRFYAQVDDLLAEAHQASAIDKVDLEKTGGWPGQAFARTARGAEGVFLGSQNRADVRVPPTSRKFRSVAPPESEEARRPVPSRHGLRPDNWMTIIPSGLGYLANALSRQEGAQAGVQGMTLSA